MALGKQAKVLNRAQTDAVLAYLQKTRHPARNRLIFLLSIRAGLRAKEIAAFTWCMVTNADGSIAADIALRDEASKGRSGRTIPISKELRSALVSLQGGLHPCNARAAHHSNRAEQGNLVSGHRQPVQGLVPAFGI